MQGIESDFFVGGSLLKCNKFIYQRRVNMSVTNIDSESLLRFTKEGVKVIDVRTDAEVSRGVIPGASHIALDKLPERYKELDPAAKVVIYCQVGGRSANAAQFLASQGFSQVFNLQGGINAWVASGHETGNLLLTQ